MIIKGAVFQHKYEVNEMVYSGFISIFLDNNPLHTNEKYALQKGFKGKVMYGNILNGFLSHFIGTCLPLKNVIIHTQEIKYLKPVYLNDTLSLFAEIDDYYESVQTAEFRFYFQNQFNIKVAKGKFSIGII
jgi:3-hydroxybutyryl-CoA dehydratase